MVRGVDWLNIVAAQHKDWIKIVEGFGERNYQEDIVQEAYINLVKYAEPYRIIKDGKIVRGYMYFTLRNIWLQYLRSKKKITKISIDDEDNLYQLPQVDNLEEQEAFYKICKAIDDISDDWDWYDRKLFKLYRDTDLSIRKIAKETNISWVSIFNTLKNCKNEIKEKLNEDYEDYKNEDYDRI